MTPITLPAPAKINLHLKVCGLLPNGMHLLHTSFIFTDACDLLHVEPADELQVVCSVAELSGANNLVYRLLQAFADRAPAPGGMRIEISKRLPAQAGLGGGSSDAATALLFANQAWQANWSRAQLIEFAAPFGADIPCFLYGRASRAGGIGDKLVPLKQDLPDAWALIAWEGSGLSTAEVFRQFDSRHAARLSLTGSGALDTMRGDRISLGENDLEAVACSLNPGVSLLLQHLRQYSRQAWMSGSGSACVALFEHRHDAEQVAAGLLDSGLASWTHCGRLQARHPLDDAACQDVAAAWAGATIGT